MQQDHHEGRFVLIPIKWTKTYCFQSLRAHRFLSFWNYQIFIKTLTGRKQAFNFEPENQENNWQMTKLWSRTTLALGQPFTWSCNCEVDRRHYLAEFANLRNSGISSSKIDCKRWSSLSDTDGKLLLLENSF
eukprot:scaffold2551_cov113-Cylindrotheca_fusiformis.AAC.25